MTTLTTLPSIQLPTVTLPALSAFGRDTRQAVTDAVVMGGRAQTPQSAVDQRETPRLSVAEMNSQTWEQLSERFNKSRVDRRPPFVKALDMIDLPRNALFNLVAPGMAARKRAEGETATFGMGRVMFSDVLRELGVENQVVRGLVGFVGDVAFDPLTYVGPAGWGARFAASGRHAGRGLIEVTAEGNRTLRRAARDAAAGRPIADQTTRNLLEVSGFTPENIVRLRAQGFSEDRIVGSINKAIRGPVGGQTRSRVIQRGLNVIGGEPTERGGMIGRRFFDEVVQTPTQLQRAMGEAGTSAAVAERVQRQTQAVREFVDRFGRATQPRGLSSRGVRFAATGRGVSEVAHIPFTGISVQIPAFTRMGQAREAIASVAGLARPLSAAQSAVAGATSAVGPVARNLDGMAAEAVRLLEDQNLEFRGMVDAIRGGEEAPALSAIRSERLAEIRAIKESVDAFIEVTPAEDVRGILELSAYRDTMNASVARLEAQQRAARQEMNSTLLALERTTDAETSRRIAEAVAVNDLQAADDIRRLSDEEIAQTVDALLDTPHEQLVSLGVEMEARAAAIAAARRAADAAGGSIMQVLTSGEKKLLRVAESQLGLTGHNLGEALIIGMAESARGGFTAGRNAALEMAHRMDVRNGQLFGRRSGHLARAVEVAKRMEGPAVDRAINNVLREYTGQIRSVAKKHGLTDKMDDLYEVSFALAAAERQNRARAAAEAARRQGLPAVQEEPFYVRPFVEGTENAFTRLARAQADGILRPEVYADLERVAASGVDLLDELGDIALDGDYLAGLVRGYLPGVPTPEMAAILRRQKDEFNLRRSTQAARESFQKPKSTWQTRFDVPADYQGQLLQPGQRVRFFEFETAYTSEMVRRLHQAGLTDEAAQVARQVETIELFRRMPDELFRDGVRPLARATDQIELNSMSTGGYFAPLTGGENIRFFDTNLATVLATRTGMQQRAMARKSMTDIFKNSPHLTIDSNAAVRRSQGGELVTTGGAKVEAFTDRQGRRFIQVGDKQYRQLSKEARETPIGQSLQDVGSANTTYFEDTVATRIEEVARQFSGANASVMLSTIDSMLGHWKAITLFHPSWMLTEMIGNVILALQGGARPDLLIKNHVHALRAVLRENNQEALRNVRVTLGDRGEIPMAQVWNESLLTGIRSAGMPSETVTMITGHGLGRLPTDPGTPEFLQGMSTYARAKTLTENGAATLMQQGGKAYSKAYQGVFRPWFALDRKLNDTMRLAAYMTFIEMGDDSLTAADKVLRNMFDYQGLTHFESNARRFLIPFMSWVKNNGVYQVHKLFESPAHAAAVPKLQAAIEEVIAGDERVPMHERPSWMKEQLALQIGRDPEKRWSITGGFTLPQADAFRLLTPLIGADGAQSFFEYFVGSANPIAKIPVEIGVGREFFTGREIGTTIEEGDLSIPEYLLGLIRPLKEFGAAAGIPAAASSVARGEFGQAPGSFMGAAAAAGPIPRAFDTGVGAGVARTIGGGRSQDFSEERLQRFRLREMKDMETSLRRAINRANRDQRPDQSLASRVRLMQLYDEMREAGFGDEVPGWARKQLDLLDAGGVPPV